jgi:hypothetical protein
MTDRNWYSKFTAALPNLYYAGTLISLIFIVAQVFYAKRSILESSEWEKAKLTIENIEQFKQELNKSPLAATDVWLQADRLLPDFSIPEGYGSPEADTLFSVYVSLFNDSITGKEKILTELREETERMIDVMNTFAYPIIMGYASEMGSFQNVSRQYYTIGAFIMPIAFRTYRNIGIHAKLLYRLWRIRFELMGLDNSLRDPGDGEFEDLKKYRQMMLFYEATEITEASLRQYRKKLVRELKKMQQEIEDFREAALE